MLFLQNELAQSKPGDSEFYNVEGVWPSLMLNKFGLWIGVWTFYDGRELREVQSVARNFFLCVSTERLLGDIVNMNLMV